jgi:hypothetical protein
MLRRRSRTIPDDDTTTPHEVARASTHSRPSIEPHTRAPELDLDLTGIDTDRPAWAEPVGGARRAAPLTAEAPPVEPADAGDGWDRLDDDDWDDEEPEADTVDEDELAPPPPPPAPAARRAPLRAAPAPVPPPSRQDAISNDIQSIVSDTVTRVLSSAMVELELEPGTLQELRDQGALHQLTAAVARIEQQTALVDGLARQIATLTTAVDELTDSTRALLRHQWENMPPSNFWVRVQRADDEVRRALEELAAEVRGRAPRPARSTRSAD